MISRCGYSPRTLSPSTNHRMGSIYGRCRAYRPVGCIEEVIQAWSGVYDSYRLIRLISPSPHRIHLMPQAVDSSVLVVVDSAIHSAAGQRGWRNGLATITAIPDVGRGIPLDEIYGEELDLLRRTSRVPIEAVLLRDDRSGDSRSMDAKFGLMRWVFFYGLYSGQTDLVFGVHPRHAPFYRRMMGATVLGREATCPRVGNAPVVGLRIDLLATLTSNQRPRAVQYIFERPLARDELTDRFELTWSAIRGTVIQKYLDDNFDGRWPSTRTPRSVLPSSGHRAPLRQLSPSQLASRRRLGARPGRTYRAPIALPEPE